MHRLLKPYGEWGIRLRSKIFKSFRFEIVLYSLLSLIYTILTEAGIYFGYLAIRGMLGKAKRESVGTGAASSGMGDIGGMLEKGSSGSIHDAMIMNPLRKEGFFLFMGLGVLIGIALFMLYFLLMTKKFARYLDEIAEGIKEMSIGNFEARILIKNQDEFSYIAGQINKMASDIKKRMEAERKNEKSRNDLVTNVAHDLRTPLTSIIGYLDLVRTKADLEAGTREKYIDIAFQKSKRLEKLIEDLFSYTKYNSEEISLNLKDIDMVKFMEQMVDEFYPSFQEAGLEYSFVSKSTEALVVADGDLLARAITNLIGNAIKYGKDGKRIQIQLETLEEELKIKVLNYGEVIPPKDLENIFERFYRVEASRSSETGGTGLGLAITKKIILMHQGSIHVKSNFNGTIFEVRLPLKKKAEQK